jgi:hypothetical protein
MGCFKDGMGRDLPDQVSLGTIVTPQACVQKCKEQGNKQFAGLQVTTFVLKTMIFAV